MASTTVTRGTIVVTAVDRPRLQDRLLHDHGQPDLAGELPAPPFVLANDIDEPSAKKILHDLAEMGITALFKPASQPAGVRPGRPSLLRRSVTVMLVLIAATLGYRMWPLLQYQYANAPLLQHLRANPSAPAVLGGQARDMRRQFEAQYRLPPDRRVLMAFAFLARASARWASDSVVLAMGEALQEDETLVIPLLRDGARVDEARLPMPLTFPRSLEALGQWIELLSRHGRPLPRRGQGLDAALLDQVAQDLHTVDPLAMLEALERLELA